MARSTHRALAALMVAVAICAPACGRKPQAGAGRDAGREPAAGNAGAGAAGIRLGSPVDCTGPAGCMVRNFVDADPGPAAIDHACGRLTYDGHDGTDIRVPDGAALVRGVSVMAAADGKVLRVRDGMDDASVHGKDKASLDGKDAGNSVVIDHGSGWETQYSHMRKGSVIVRPGDEVRAGGRIGLVGLSGFTEFSHVHFEVRHHGRPVDPYTGLEAGAGCGAIGEPLWTGEALSALAYAAETVMDAGFATVPEPDAWAARAGAYAGALPGPGSEALVFWVDVVGPLPGDLLHMRLVGPGGLVVADHAEEVAGGKVSRFFYLGDRMPAAGWPAGTYRGTFTLSRPEGMNIRALIDLFREIEIRAEAGPLPDP